MKLELKIDISRRTILFITLFLSAILIASATSFSSNQLLINQSTGILFGNTSINQTTIVTDFLHGNGSNITSVNADTVDGYHLNQGVRTTDSPTFVGMNSTYANISGVNVTEAPCSYGFGGGYSYLICTDGTTVYAKNGSTGKVDYSGTNDSLVIQSVINLKPSDPIKIRAGIYLLDAPLTKDYVEPITIFGAETMKVTNYFTSSTVLRSNASMAYTMKFVGRGSLQNVIIDGNNLATTALDASYSSLGVNNTLYRYVVATQGTREAVNATHADTIVWEHSTFARSPTGYNMSALAGQQKLIDPYFSFNTNAGLWLKSTDVFSVYGGVWAGAGSNTVCDVILEGGVRLDSYSTWMESGACNFEGRYLSSTAGVPSLSLNNGRYHVNSSSEKENIYGQYNIIINSGVTRFINGTKPDLTNFTNTTNRVYLEAFDNGTALMNFTNVSKYYYRHVSFTKNNTNLGNPYS